jgi:hypothetical protein
MKYQVTHVLIFLDAAPAASDIRAEMNANL